MSNACCGGRIICCAHAVRSNHGVVGTVIRDVIFGFIFLFESVGHAPSRCCDETVSGMKLLVWRWGFEDERFAVKQSVAFIELRSTAVTIERRRSETTRKIYTIPWYVVVVSFKVQVSTFFYCDLEANTAVNAPDSLELLAKISGNATSAVTVLVAFTCASLFVAALEQPAASAIDKPSKPRADLSPTAVTLSIFSLPVVDCKITNGRRQHETAVPTSCLQTHNQHNYRKMLNSTELFWIGKFSLLKTRQTAEHTHLVCAQLNKLLYQLTSWF